MEQFKLKLTRLWPVTTRQAILEQWLHLKESPPMTTGFTFWRSFYYLAMCLLSLRICAQALALTNTPLDVSVSILLSKVSRHLAVSLSVALLPPFYIALDYLFYGKEQRFFWSLEYDNIIRNEAHFWTLNDRQLQPIKGPLSLRPMECCLRDTCQQLSSLWKCTTARFHSQLLFVPCASRRTRTRIIIISGVFGKLEKQLSTFFGTFY